MQAADGLNNKALNKPAVNNSKHRKLLQTDDGSYTLWVEDVNETYHSRHGAEQESLHVFISNGLDAIKKIEISILEVGLGSGLNVLLTLEKGKDRKIFYTALEPFPLNDVLVEQLCVVQANEDRCAVMKGIHTSFFGQVVELKDNFRFVKQSSGIEAFCSNEHFDLIYFDAFAPSFEPHLWTQSVMRRCFDLLNAGGIWVSYCAKGEVRRNLIAAGFQVERLPGPPGKREMLRAWKK